MCRLCSASFGYTPTIVPILIIGGLKLQLMQGFRRSGIEEHALKRKQRASQQRVAVAAYLVCDLGDWNLLLIYLLY